MSAEVAKKFLDNPPKAENDDESQVAWESVQELYQDIRADDNLKNRVCLFNVCVRSGKPLQCPTTAARLRTGAPARTLATSRAAGRSLPGGSRQRPAHSTARSPRTAGRTREYRSKASKFHEFLKQKHVLRASARNIGATVSTIDMCCLDLFMLSCPTFFVISRL